MQPDVLTAIAIGGALGAPARYGISKLMPVGADGFPWATLVINLSGAFVLGVFLTLVVERFPPSEYLRPFFAVGFLGAYTTFSTLAVETAVLVKDHHAVRGIAYATVSVTAGLVVAYLGITVGRVLPPRRRASDE